MVKSEVLLPEVVLDKNGLLIDGHRLKFVVDDSVSVNHQGGVVLVSLTLVAGSFESKGTESLEYSFTSKEK
ncbi:hypothetical protein [Streptococcus danieliae]|uniref:hypothetical protein n=1 Tax=Streptococcus danieliae TaxID=747656 RepID=UPI0021C98659|nr:hypothetical protein [Streptococcus danieliae]MCU0081871.1 hypothetical protein [Streptococcus danieliae]